MKLNSSGRRIQLKLEIRILIFYGAFFLFLFPSANWAQLKVEGTQKWNAKRARNFLEKKLFLSAIAYLEPLAEEQNKNPEFCYLLGKSFFLAGQKNKALPWLQAAFEFQFSDPDFIWFYALTLQYNRQYKEAITQLDKLKKSLKPGDLRGIELGSKIGQCRLAQEYSQKEPRFRVENLGETINTPWPDFAPVITADEELLFFTSRRPENLGENAQDEYPYEDVYFSKSEEGGWQKARPLGSPINTEVQEACIALSPDGQDLYLFRSDNKGDIFISRSQGEKWSAPKNLDKNINTADYREPSVCVSSDGSVLFFVSDKPGGVGGLDIYVSYRRKDGSFGPGYNLGPPINTPFDEDAPFLHPNGKTLYFSSRGHKGAGGYDIFRSELKAPQQWSAPENLGFPLNSPDDDIYFVLSANGKSAYFASNRKEGFGHLDIYKATFLDSLAQEKPRDYIMLKGVVTAKGSGAPLQAALSIIDNLSGDTLQQVFSNSFSGKYIVILPTGGNYGIYAEAPGFMFHSENILLSQYHPYQEFIKNVELQPLAKGTKIILNNIFFDFDKSVLREESFPELGRVVALLKNASNLKVKILGHTDSEGSDSYNLKLSHDRAAAVAAYLQEKGIDKARIAYQGYGETLPLDTNLTPEGRKNNRRTEIEILE
jgi:outer membrane protein OmpA-like peptidoglycan-associated protein